MTDRELYCALKDRLAKGLPAAMATIVEAHGSTPRKVGAKMLVFPDASTVGTIGGGCGEGQVIRAGIEAILATRHPATVLVDLTDELGTRGGDVCGGKMKVFVEPIFP